MKRKVLIVGLDGATFDIIGPLMDMGSMPTLADLATRGTGSTLRSTVPPATGPSWLTMATGLSPETTGVYDFVVVADGEGHRLRGIGSREYAGRAVWDYLGAREKKVAILNFPMLLPPYEVNGFMTAGVGATPDDDYTFPTGLKQELNRIAGGHYELVVPYHDLRFDDTDLFLECVERALETHTRAAEHLVGTREWDLFWVVLSATDWYQHRMWGVDGPGAAADRAFWSRVDDAVGRIVKAAGDGVDVLIVSDHGFGINDRVFRLNAWLEREGFLVRAPISSRLTARGWDAVWGAVRAATRLVGVHKLAPRLYDRGRRTKERSVLGVRDVVDINRSTAFDPGHTVPFGAVYINRSLVPQPSDRLRTAREIGKRLQSWGEKESLPFDVWFPAESVDVSSQAPRRPDLIIGADGWRCVLIKDELDGALIENRPFSRRHRGSHRLNGILIAAGPRLGSAAPVSARVVDIAPTVLHLLGEPVPLSMEGRVLNELLDAAFLNANPVRREKMDDVGTDAPDENEMSPEAEAEMKRRLQDLGYL